MAVSLWAIDSALLLHPIDSLSDGAKPIARPEQSIDTVLLRNLEVLTESLLTRRGRFLFHSTEYWGPFDVGCMLSDGALATFENKGKSVSREGFSKFCRDIETVTRDSEAHIRHRFEHVKRYLDDYYATAERMFAGFFLGVRCDTQSARRDLSAEAANLLGLSREQFAAEFRKGAGWLDRVRTCDSLGDYLAGFADGGITGHIVPVFLVPADRVRRVEPWFHRSSDCSSVRAILASYQFFADETPFPQGLSTQIVGEFWASIE